MLRELPFAATPEDLLEAHLIRSSRRGEVFHAGILLLLLLLLGLLPIVRVDVSVRGAGILRPKVEKHQLRSPASGVVEALHVRPNESVSAGQVLVQLESGSLESHREIVQGEIDRVSNRLADLEVLLAAAPEEVGLFALRTQDYGDEATHFHERRLHLLFEVEQRSRMHRRVDTLVQRGLLPLADLEESALQLARLHREQDHLEAESRARWNSMASTLRRERAELDQSRHRLQEEIGLLTIRAPIDGTIEEMLSISAGSYLHAGDLLLIISPDSGLVAEVHVEARDIGMLASGMPARLLVDAFHHADWGVLPGQISTISSDYHLIDGRPMFRIGITPEETTLRLRSGAEGEVRKGMTVQARFMVAERTLWQFLRDGLNDWLNPTQPPD